MRLMIDMLERKSACAHQLYEQRERKEGKAVEDWVKAEAEILRSSAMSLLWRTRHLLEVV